MHAEGVDDSNMDSEEKESRANKNKENSTQNV